LKLDRLLAITMLLLNRKRVGAKELSERFEVSLRTIYRDLETLGQAGIPIVSFAGGSGGYEIMDQYRLERQFLSMEELQSIIVALKGIRSTFDDQDIAGLLDKVGALVAKSEQHRVTSTSQEVIIDLNPWQRGNADKEKLGLLRSSIRLTQIIRFTYTSSGGEEMERRCEPMGVVLKGYSWYLYGFCLLRGDYRIFRLSRMKDLDVSEELFVRRKETLDDLDFSWSRREDTNSIRLVLIVQPRVRARIEDYFEHGEVEVREDGSLLVTADQPEEPWLYGMLLSYGADVRVVEPPHVACLIAEKAKEIVALYETTLT
jgi:predicted DNA-binding transcriptional regulator YafY